ncbi:hypothetical protein DRQ25_05175 [Candidatus Fermentibacteria bacterium]|nr:MAG: hypothetical protein DRQ25_05175 [Candidatus Fermentibacteria bacterium]
MADYRVWIDAGSGEHFVSCLRCNTSRRFEEGDDEEELAIAEIEQHIKEVHKGQYRVYLCMSCEKRRFGDTMHIPKGWFVRNGPGKPLVYCGKCRTNLAVNAEVHKRLAKARRFGRAAKVK